MRTAWIGDLFLILFYNKGVNPDLYHAHHNRHLDDLPFWQGLAARQGGLILELGCGTGRLLIPLAEAGYRLVGLDYDAGMLEALQARLPATSAERVGLVQADLRAIPAGPPFPVNYPAMQHLEHGAPRGSPCFFSTCGRLPGCGRYFCGQPAKSGESGGLENARRACRGGELPPSGYR